MPSDSIRPKASCVRVSAGRPGCLWPVRDASGCHVTRVVQIRLAMRHGSEVMAGWLLLAASHTHIRTGPGERGDGGDGREFAHAARPGYGVGCG